MHERGSNRERERQRASQGEIDGESQIERVIDSDKEIETEGESYDHLQQSQNEVPDLRNAEPTPLWDISGSLGVSASDVSLLRGTGYQVEGKRSNPQVKLMEWW